MLEARQGLNFVDVETRRRRLALVARLAVLRKERLPVRQRIRRLRLRIRGPAQNSHKRERSP